MKSIVLPFPCLYFEWYRLQVRAIFIFFTTQILAVFYPFWDLEIGALPAIAHTRLIQTAIFVNFRQSYPLKGDSTNFQPIFVLHALGTNDSKKLGQHSNLKVHLFSNNFFVQFRRSNRNLALILCCKKDLRTRCRRLHCNRFSRS